MSSPMTLRDMQGAPNHASPLADASLVLIDLQEEYRTGLLPLHRIDDAVAQAASMLRLAREHATPVFHIVHRLPEQAPIFNPTLPGYQIMREVAPRDDEPVIAKTHPDAFANTDLDAQLRRTGRSELIVVGAQTHTCISASVRAAFDLGWRCTVVADACTTRDLPTIEGGFLAAADVHRTALAELADAFGVVVEGIEAWRTT